ncbi:hypothetical protein KSB_39510 [Ktedonobacter robiniae]|uniref:Uncharacterized protein n=1 Tax=Ktedonobacter robiniae TaxID=2778365 RepID=A0ABQ3URT3_9CHLR|nr:hypothetical protein KSB_39510 [Ktedonobacter robiniae]
MLYESGSTHFYVVTLIAHPGVVKLLGQVATTRVREQHDQHILGGKTLSIGHSRRQGRAPRATNQDTLLACQAPGPVERGTVINTNHIVDNSGIIVTREHIHADTFDLVGPGGIARVDRAWRVRANDFDLWILLFEIAAGPRNSSTCADARDESRDLARRIAPNLWARRAIVRRWIGRVRILVGTARARNLLRQAIGDIFVVLWRVMGNAARADHNLRAIRAQQASLLLAGLVGHDEDAVIAFDRRRDCQAMPGITARWLDNRPTWTQQALLLAVLDHRRANAILHAPTRIKKLHLRQYHRRHIACDALQLHQRRIPDPL